MDEEAKGISVVILARDDVEAGKAQRIRVKGFIQKNIG